MSSLPLFQGGDTGSNPVGDANHSNSLAVAFGIKLAVVRQPCGKADAGRPRTKAHPWPRSRAAQPSARRGQRGPLTPVDGPPLFRSPAGRRYRPPVRPQNRAMRYAAQTCWSAKWSATLPHWAGPEPGSTGSACPIPGSSYVSPLTSPAAPAYTRRRYAPVVSSPSGTSSIPSTAVHWSSSSRRFVGSTVSSASPCQSDTRGQAGGAGAPPPPTSSPPAPGPPSKGVSRTRPPPALPPAQAAAGPGGGGGGRARPPRGPPAGGAAQAGPPGEGVGGDPPPLGGWGRPPPRAGAAVGHAGDDRPAGERLRVGGEHDGRHGTPGRE